MAPGGRSTGRTGNRRFPSRGRGGSRGGRFKGRPGSQQHRGVSQFDSARLANIEDELDGDDAPENEDPPSASGSDESDDEDEGTNSNGRPYLALMRSLVQSAPRKAKRRKLEHSAPPENAQEAREGDRSTDGGEAEQGDESADPVDGPELDEQDDAPLGEEELFDNDDDLDTSDPFEVHFANPDEDAVAEKVEVIRDGQWQLDRLAASPWKVFVNTPKVAGSVETVLPKPLLRPADLKLKQKLREAASREKPEFDTTEGFLAPLIFNHRDVLFCERTVANASSLRWMACLHALNHIFKTRDRVIKDNARLSKDQNSADLELRDQGFTRPKVLILLPTRQSCAKVVDMLCRICEPDQQENRKRFDESFTDKQQTFGEDKPADFKDLFDGNDDDMFRLGVKFTRKSIKYFAQFYNSDILMASPLGLRMAIGSEDDKKSKNKVDFDFLSSIELVIVDQAEALLMQNWEHVEYIFDHLNVQPRDAHGCDFSRVRSWYLEDQARNFRQNIILSSFNTPELSELFRTRCHNWSGKARVQREQYHGAMLRLLGHGTRQTFSRFESPSVQQEPDARFAYFTKAVVPALARSAKDSAGTLVLVPSYLDFVRVRNYFASDPAAERLSFGSISEYADVPEASRARSHFLNGRHRVLLYTERAHHFRRYRIKGVRRVIFYGLPDNPLFYEEIAADYLRLSEQALILEPGQGSVRVLFSKYDVLKLERIVGSQRVGRMIRERGDTFEFL